MKRQRLSLIPYAIKLHDLFHLTQPIKFLESVVALNRLEESGLASGFLIPLVLEA